MTCDMERNSYLMGDEGSCLLNSLTNLVLVPRELSQSFWHFMKTTVYHLGWSLPSLPSSKELFACDQLMTYDCQMTLPGLCAQRENIWPNNLSCLLNNKLTPTNIQHNSVVKACWCNHCMTTLAPLYLDQSPRLNLSMVHAAFYLNANHSAAAAIVIIICCHICFALMETLRIKGKH